MGVTVLRPNFTQIIGHNSVNVHRIPTKLGTEIRFNESILQSVRKEEEGEVEEEEKNEEKKPKPWPLVSWKWLERFSSNLECGLPYLAGTSVATLVSLG